MSKHGLIALAAAAALLATPVQAATLTNRSADEVVVQINEEGDEIVSKQVTLAPDETVTDVCDQGCVMVLENGAQQSFEGDEIIYLEDGGFVIAE